MTYSDVKAFEARRQEVQGHARRTRIAGLTMLIGGFLLIAAFWTVLVMTMLNHRLYASGALLVAGLAVVVAGGRKLWMAGRLAKFG